MNSGRAKTGSKNMRRANPAWPSELEGWRRLLSECEQKPTRKRVHALRVATLRLQAQTEYWLGLHCREGYDADQPAAPAVKKWQKEARHLRRALGAVRNCDIYLVKLQDLRGPLTTSTGYEPRSSRTPLRQIGQLERQFKRDRRAAGQRLLASIEHRRERVESAIVGIESGLSPHLPLVPRLDLHALVGLNREMVSEFPELRAKDLHTLRKRIKDVRYLAELMSGNDLQIAALAAELKAVQGAIGEWHDWDDLACEAANVLRHGPKNGNLIELLETMAQESLEKALALCESFRARFAVEEDEPAQRKTPHRAASVTTGAKSLCA
jgi:CHAD domain-containing protein